MSLRARLAIWFSVVVGLGIAAASVIGYVSTRAELDESIDEFLRMRADELVEGARALPQDRDRRNDDRPPQSQTLPADPDAIIQALDQRGAIVANTGGELPVDATDLAVADKDRKPVLRTVTVDGEDFRIITEHVRGGGAIQVARSLEENQGVLAGLRNRSVLIGGVLSLVAAMIGWFVAARTTRPLRSLTVAAEEVAETQDLDIPIEVDRTDEVGRLATSFDEMLTALARSRDQQHRLIQDAGHELRTPLTSLQANIELLERAPDLAEPQRSELLRSLRSEVVELNALFAELIELATDAREEVTFETIDLDDPAARAADIFDARTTREIDATYGGGQVSGSQELLERAIGNLLANADKFSPPGAPIELVVADRTISVRDQGPGIPMPERERVFDRFYRSDSTRSMPGSGLGLAIVQQIVERHGGRVFVGDAPGGGAEVGFTLPPLELEASAPRRWG